MKTKLTVIALFLLLATSAKIFGQSDDLRLFGYFQNNFNHFDVAFDNQPANTQLNSFLMQQMNIMLAKNYGTEFSSFVNIELTNSFSSKDSIGAIKIEEAWFKYSPSSLFSVKAGVLTPRFNNFNEIKNRTVLLPYVFRPTAYETYFFDQFGTREFAPATANIQIYGELPVGDLYVNYAVYAGNSETAMLFTNSNSYGPGQDPTKFKLVGGRLGVEYGDLQFGASFAADRKNLTLSTHELGLVPRVRLGAYLNYSLAGFELEGEYINLKCTLSQDNKDTLAAAAAIAPPWAPVPQDYNKTFWNVNLIYNITDDATAYAGYDYLGGGDNIFVQGGLKTYSVGGSYKATGAIILKAEYTRQIYPAFFGMKAIRNDYLVGASVSF